MRRFSISRIWYEKCLHGLWRVKALVFAFGLTALPLIAWADDDDAPVPLDPKTKAAQNWTFGTIALIVVLAIVWYQWRRRQITRSGKSVEGLDAGQD